MSKKRKTKKQKVVANLRSIEHVAHIHTQAPTYSVTGLTTEIIKIQSKPTSSVSSSTVAQKDAEYLHHDMVSITAASGIVAAFDILLFVLLSTGFIHLHFLGY